MLETQLGYDTGFCEIVCYVPGQRAEWRDGSKDDGGARGLYYTVRKGWRPNYFVAEALRGLGRKSMGRN
jgi:hypothetical protein